MKHANYVTMALASKGRRDSGDMVGRKEEKEEGGKW